jgi:hypothetical protein
MAQRESGYVRRPRDAYMTPAWVTEVLLDRLERERLLPVTERVPDPSMFSKAFKIDTGRPLAIWEPAAGTGVMASVMAARGYEVIASDIAPEPGVGFAHDFLGGALPVLLPAPVGAVITNPPYAEAEDFVATALDIVQPAGGVVAMLLKVDWDSAKTRRRFFAETWRFRMKIVLTDRIHWFDPEPGSAGPSENHAWFIWSCASVAQCQPREFLDGAKLAYAEAPARVRDELRAKRKAVAA